jgi:hypothetical protein
MKLNDINESWINLEDIREVKFYDNNEDKYSPYYQIIINYKDGKSFREYYDSNKKIRNNDYEDIRLALTNKYEKDIKIKSEIEKELENKDNRISNAIDFIRINTKYRCKDNEPYLEFDKDDIELLLKLLEDENEEF